LTESACDLGGVVAFDVWVEPAGLLANPLDVELSFCHKFVQAAFVFKLGLIRQLAAALCAPMEPVKYTISENVRRLYIKQQGNTYARKIDD